MIAQQNQNLQQPQPWTADDERRAMELSDNATPGPWHCIDRGCLGHDVGGVPVGIRGMFDRVEDAAFIAAARTLLPAAVAEIRQRGELIKSIVAACRKVDFGTARQADAVASLLFAVDKAEHEINGGSVNG